MPQGVRSRELNGLGKRTKKARLRRASNRATTTSVRKRRCALCVCMVHACQQERAATAAVVRLTHSLRHCITTYYDSTQAPSTCSAALQGASRKRRSAATERQAGTESADALHTPFLSRCFA